MVEKRHKIWYFAPNALPPDLSPMLALRFAEWVEAAEQRA